MATKVQSLKDLSYLRVKLGKNQAETQTMARSQVMPLTKVVIMMVTVDMVVVVKDLLLRVVMEIMVATVTVVETMVTVEMLAVVLLEVKAMVVAVNQAVVVEVHQVVLLLSSPDQVLLLVICQTTFKGSKRSALLLLITLLNLLVIRNIHSDISLVPAALIFMLICLHNNLNITIE